LSNNFVEQPTKEGEAKDCPNCGKPLVARLKVYKDWPDKVIWQNKEDTEAHYTKDGNCKGETPKEEPKPDNKKQTELPKDATLSVEHERIISTKARLLWRIRLQVEATIKALESDPNGGMIWEMTKIIYQELYGDKK